MALVQCSVTVSSSCGRKTLIRKSSRKDVKVLDAISDSGGMMSRSRWRKTSDGGRSRPMLETSGSTRSLCAAVGA